MTELRLNFDKKAIKRGFAGFMATCMCVATLYVAPAAVSAATKAATAGNGTSVSENATTAGNGTSTDASVTAGNGTSTETVSKGGKIASVTLSKTSYVYNGKAKKPTVTVKDSNGNIIEAANYTVKYTNNKTVGKATVKVTAKGDKFTGSKSVTFKINPAKTSITKIVAKSKGFQVTWKKQATQTTGYQVRYSTSSKFTASKTETVKLAKNTTVNKTIAGLSAGKKYYVQVRTYKTVDGKTYYSAWSDSVIITTKK